MTIIYYFTRWSNWDTVIYLLPIKNKVQEQIPNFHWDSVDHLIFDGGILRIGDKLLKACSEHPHRLDDVGHRDQLVGPELQQDWFPRAIMQDPHLLTSSLSFYIYSTRPRNWAVCEVGTLKSLSDRKFRS